MTERSISPVDSRMGYRFAKRGFDLLVAGIAVLVLSPVFAVIAIGVKASSPGPVLYRGRRTGQHGHEFAMFKFRTMQVDAERFGTTTALRDPRVTRLGAVLRHYKLDELPQFFNVLRGEMSLVGPRPEVEEHTNAYTEEERAILSVRPGITDLSSIRFSGLTELLGAQNAHEVFLTTYRAEKNALRLRYVRERSFWTDLKIIGLTCRAECAKLFTARSH